jgi:hypothetical protein
LFIKLPLAASKFLVYTLLRVAISKEKKKINKISLRSFLFNMVFINLFGSPRWLFELSLLLSSDVINSLNTDLSLKNYFSRPIIRYRLVLTSINSIIISRCNYFLSKCNESKIIKSEKGIIFNMFNFSFKRGGSYFINNTKVMAAVTSCDGKIRNHPLHDDNYEGGTSDGSVYTHIPMEGQRGLALVDKNGKCHYGIYNNAQEESAISVNRKMNINQSEDLCNIERKVIKTVQFFDDCPIFYQSSGKTKLLNQSYKDLKERDAINLGFKSNKLSDFDSLRRSGTFQSQSEEDTFVNEINYGLSNDINHNFQKSCKYTLDCRNITNIEKFKSLSGRKIISRLSYEKFKRND